MGAAVGSIVSDAMITNWDTYNQTRTNAQTPNSTNAPNIQTPNNINPTIPNSQRSTASQENK